MTINCQPQPPLQVYGNPINHVTNFRYLGSMMGSSASDLKRRKALAWTAFWKLEHLWKSPTIPISTKVKLFDTTCVTVLLYGCESWVISKDMENKINSFGTSCYSIMLNIKRVDRVTVPNTTIYNLTETTPLVVRARIRQLKFIGHILRLPNDELAKEYALYVPGRVLDFGLDGGVPPGPRDPNPCLEVKKVPMFRDFAQKMDPCIGIF